MVVYLLSYILDYYYVRTFSDTCIGIIYPPPKHVLLIVWYFVIYVFLYIFVQTTKVVHVLVALFEMYSLVAVATC